MKIALRYANRHAIIVFLLGLFCLPTQAKSLPHLNDTTFYDPYPYVIILSDDEPLPQFTDDQFFDQAASAGKDDVPRHGIARGSCPA